jgi:hypothetical protein
MTAARLPGERDPRLDFFRGLAMFVIVIAHTPGNPWTLWIPARFGFSDATEIFVFCSGMASAIAFGGTFARHGWAVGAARTLYRVWQVYWAHVGVFLSVATLVVLMTAADVTGRDYVAGLNLVRFFDDPAIGLPALMTLRYVPNYFDILPMYLVILAMLPVAVALARVHPGLVALASGTVWLAAALGQLDLPASPWVDRVWFFNPFGWQVAFFTGYAFMAGWLPAPPVRPALVTLAAVVVVLSVPFAWFRLLDASPALAAGAEALWPLTGKTDFGALRYVHFLAVAYLAWVAVGPAGRRLEAGRVRPRVVAVVRKVGQQSLGVFVAGLALAQALGVAIDVLGHSAAAMAAVNLGGMAAVVGTAYLVGWFRDEPWRRPAAAAAAPSEPAPPGRRANARDGTTTA